MSQQHTAESNQRPDGAAGDAVEEMLDRDGEDSFPASDPPSHWSGEN